MVDKISGISESAVRKATGKGWDDWFTLIDREGYKGLSHKEIAARLHDDGHIDSEWWCQMVTVGYEKAQGLRVVGQTADAGFQIGAQKTLPLSPGKAWELITSPEGRSIWLGRISKISFVEGYEYQTEEGTSGKIGTVVSGNRLRLSWKPKRWRKSSNIQIRINPSGKKSAISVHHDRLESAERREEMKKYWREVLRRFQDLVEARG